MGMGFGGAAAMAGGPVGAVLRRVPDGLPVQVQPLAGRNIGGFAAWRDWDNGGQQRPEDHRQPPHQPPLPENVRTSRRESHDAAESSAAWQRNVVRNFKRTRYAGFSYHCPNLTSLQEA